MTHLGRGPSSAESAMLHRHVSTVAQKGQTALGRMHFIKSHHKAEQ